ncbi:MAG: DUF1573 domain-containing protein, partial [Candidatus Omnitrophica bacterium]|nr:DUF1573 domain-containing protein [Candidatus Omnitrophota bacterium]
LFSILPLSSYTDNQDQVDLAKEDPYVWDFGEVKEGVILEHSFTLKNESGQPLNITDITTSCGCTVSEVEKKILLPGEETVIKVRFNTKGYSGSTQQFVYVKTDTLDNSVLRYIIKADVIKE